MPPERRLSDADYRQLLDLRDGLRRFLKWSANQAREAGVTPSQHQLLLVVRAHGDSRGPTVGDVAEHLLLRHNSAVELIGRCEALDLVERIPDRDDQRSVRVRLTPSGLATLEALSGLHLAELGRLAPRLPPIWSGLGPDGDG